MEVFHSKDGYYKVIQHPAHWDEYYLTVDDTWELQSSNEGKFAGFPWE